MFPTYKPFNASANGPPAMPATQPFNASANGPPAMPVNRIIPTSGGGPPPQFVYVPPILPPGYHIAPTPILPTTYGLPPCCPNCGSTSAIMDMAGARFNCGYPNHCYGTPIGFKIEDPTDCICHITILVSRGCPSTRGLPCPSRKK